MIRVVGFILVVSGCATVGILQAASVKRTAKLYEGLRLGLIWMKNEISYSLVPLEQATGRVAQMLPSPLNALFRRLSDSIAADPGCSLAWTASGFFEFDNALPVQMQDILLDLLRMLGRQDTSSQVRVLELAEARVNAVLQQLEKDKAERCRSYKSLGFCAGLALAVILL